MKEKKITELSQDHPAKKYGYNYNVQIFTSGSYCGNGKFFKTLPDAINWEI